MSAPTTTPSATATSLPLESLSLSSVVSTESTDASWNWNQAQTADGRTYYFNDQKVTKWILTREEKMKMLQTLEQSFRKMEGYMWKRAPRHSDNDKSSVRRLMTPHWRTLFKKRYFLLEPSSKTLYYYADASKPSLLGSVDLTSVTAVSTSIKDKSDLMQLPTEFILNVTTHQRLWTFVCETGEEQAAWNQCMQFIIFQNTQMAVEVGHDASIQTKEDAKGKAAAADNTNATGDANAAKRSSVLTSNVKRKNSLVANNVSVAEKIAKMLDKKNAAENAVNDAGKAPKQKGMRARLSKVFTSTKKDDGGGGEGGTENNGRRVSMTSSKFKSPETTYGGSAEAQAKRMSTLAVDDAAGKEGEWKTRTANVPVECLSVMSEHYMKDFAFCKYLAKNGVDPSRLEKFIDEHAKINFLAEGDYLVEENAPARAMFLVVSGEFLRQKNIHGDQFGISVLEPGDTSGLLEFLNVGFHVSSIVAGRSSVVLEMDPGEFEDFLKSLNLDVSVVMRGLCTDYVADLLSCVPLLLDLELAVLKKIAKNFSMVRYEKKQKLFECSQLATEFVVVMNGTTKASTGGANEGDPQIVGLYSSGDWMNEDAIRQKRNYPVDLTAVSDNCMALVCNTEGFERMLELGGGVLANSMQRVVSGRLAQAMGKCSVFAGLSALTSKFAEFMHFDEVPSGTTICNQFGKVDGFYIVLSGELDMLVDSIGGVELARPHCKKKLKMNDFFGADWLLFNKGEAQASVIASSHCVLLRTPSASFDELSVMCPLLRTRLDKLNEEQKEKDGMELKLVKAVEEAVMDRERKKGGGN